ncbi:DUF6586 family protein [Cognataquiflexum rubidum]|uniref:DUF6586 family protein n=1 Tax=Cognataquiflexum rubidum TaxID=2922273 RepID=UPI001F13BCDF|nr:hypothetical protein [Cognataquiflexum rubidum]MCH6234491.1 hypothetical protein [Cognataquiflexum rubidum]
MKMKNYTPLKAITESRLNYAKLYLEELKNPAISGSEIEKAHQYSFLFHLKGVVDAFLVEINEIYGLGLKKKHLTIDSLKVSKSDSKKPIKEGKKLSKLMEKDNWLSELKSFDPNKLKAAKKSKKSKDKDESSTLEEEKSAIQVTSVLEKFDAWHTKMEKLITELRESALDASGKSAKK